MIFISTIWSETMLVGEHTLVDLHQIDEEVFKKLAVDAHSCINKPNLAKILGVEFNFEHVQLRPGDALLKVVIKGGKLQPFDEELPENYLETMKQIVKNRFAISKKIIDTDYYSYPMQKR